MAILKIYECYDENNKKDLTLEVWASSTKHPDAKFYFADFKKSEWCVEKHQVFQWLLECASKMSFPSTAKQIADLAYEKYITWEKPRESQAFLARRWRSAFGRNSIIPHRRHFCQVKSCTNFCTKFSRILCIIPT